MKHPSADPSLGRFTTNRARFCSALSVAGAVVLLSACGSRGPMPNVDQSALPADIRVPAGNVAVLQATGRGVLLYECQAIRRAPFEYTWLLRNPSLELQDGGGRVVTYFPGTLSRWVHSDGSEVVAREFVEVATQSGNLPLLRAKADPTDARGVLENISYVQNLRTQGGVVSSRPCTAAALGMRMTVTYEADYVFWRPANRS